MVAKGWQSLFLAYVPPPPGRKDPGAFEHFDACLGHAVALGAFVPAPPPEGRLWGREEAPPGAGLREQRGSQASPERRPLLFPEFDPMSRVLPGDGKMLDTGGPQRGLMLI